MSKSRLVVLVGALLFAAAPGLAQDDDLEARVREGRLDARLVAAFEHRVLAGLTKSLGDEALLRWLRNDARARAIAAWVSARLPEPAVFARLERLWRAEPRSVRARPDLAFGIAVAFRHGSDDAPARAYESWTEGRAAIPTIERSLAWFCEHERRLTFPIARAPWIVLAFTGLDDVPIGERDWALARYRGKKVDALRGIFAEVPYIGGGLDGHAKTLANMIEHGGVCTVNTQYAMSVMRTLGFPATFGGGPGHCWPCWLELDRGKLRFARSNDLGNRDGHLGQTVLPELEHESDLRRLAAACNDSVDDLRKADLAAAAARLHPGPGATRLLLAALQSSPLAATAWLTFARQCRDGAIASDDEAAARTLLRRMPKALAAHPDLAMRTLATLGLDRADARGEAVKRLGDELERCAVALAKTTAGAGRDDLAAELARFRARLIELRRPPAEAWQAFRELARRAVADGSEAPLAAALDGMDRTARAADAIERHLRALRDLRASCDDAARALAIDERRWRLLDETGAAAAAAALRWQTLQRSAGDDANDPAPLGGGGGAAFDDRGARALPLVGVRWTPGSYHGIPVVGSVQPLFRGRDDAIVAGARHGHGGGRTVEVLAPPGHVVVGIAVASGDAVDGFALAFAAPKGAGFDAKTLRFSAWCGGSDRGQRLRIGMARGLRGRAGDLVDALTLSFE